MRRYRRRLGSDYTVNYPAAQGQRVSHMLSGYQMGLNMFSAIAIFVGGFLVFNAFSMTVVSGHAEIRHAAHAGHDVAAGHAPDPDRRPRSSA